MTLTFHPGDGQRRSRLALWADTPFGPYVLDEGHVYGPNHSDIGTCRTVAEGKRMARKDWDMRLREARR